MKAVQVAGRRVELEELTAGNAPELLELCLARDDPYGWPLWGYHHDAQSLFASLADDSAASFLIRPRDAPEAIGMVRACQINYAQGTASAEVLLDERYWSSGWALEAVIVLLHLLFQRDAIHKVYFEVTDSVLDRIRSAIGTWVSQEARLHDHLYSSGSYHDVVVLSVTRAVWVGEIVPLVASLLETLETR